MTGNTELVNNGPEIFPYPWQELMQAFINNSPRRLEMESVLPRMDASFLFKEFRRLQIRGPRQSGKSIAAIAIATVNEDVGIIRRDDVTHPVFDKIITTYPMDDDFKEKIKGIKVLILDDVNLAYWTFYLSNKEWFHPEFCVIEIVSG